MTPVYVQYGCGFSVGEGWLNFDCSPTLRIERLPLIGKTLGGMAGNTQSFPAQVKYGDICRGLPIPDNSVRGVYASHILEHLAYHDFKKALQNTFRILEPGGIFRLIVPDLQERANRYIEEVSSGSPEASMNFMRDCCLGLKSKPKSVLGRIRQQIGGSAHLWMWDEPSIIERLKLVGFNDIRRCEFGDYGDPMFSQVEDRGRFISGTGRELAITARKPQFAE